MGGWTLDRMDGWDGSLGWVKYRAPYGANKLCASSKSSLAQAI